MPKEKLSMRKIQEVIRLKWDCQKSHRQITESCSIAQSTVSDYLTRAKAEKIFWPLNPNLDEEKLESLLFAKKCSRSSEKRPEPSWERVHAESKRKGVILQQL